MANINNSSTSLSVALLSVTTTPATTPRLATAPPSPAATGECARCQRQVAPRDECYGTACAHSSCVECAADMKRNDATLCPADGCFQHIEHLLTVHVEGHLPVPANVVRLHRL